MSLFLGSCQILVEAEVGGGYSIVCVFVLFDKTKLSFIQSDT